MLFDKRQRLRKAEAAKKRPPKVTRMGNRHLDKHRSVRKPQGEQEQGDEKYRR